VHKVAGYVNAICKDYICGRSRWTTARKATVSQSSDLPFLRTPKNRAYLPQHLVVDIKAFKNTLSKLVRILYVLTNCSALSLTLLYFHQAAAVAMANETLSLDTITSDRNHLVVECQSGYDVDNAELTRLGKKPVLKVRSD
jgi:hypothetical protein